MSSPLPLALRILSAIGSVLVFILGLICSLGAIIAAPLGLWVARRRAASRGRQFTRVNGLFGAVGASALLAVTMWLVVIAVTPGPTPEQLKAATADAQHRSTVKMPDWYTRMFPQAAQADSATRQLMESPGTLRAIMYVSAAMFGLVLGAVGGGLGWCSALLWRLAWPNEEIQAPVSAARV